MGRRVRRGASALTRLLTERNDHGRLDYFDLTNQKLPAFILITLHRWHVTDRTAGLEPHQSVRRKPSLGSIPAHSKVSQKRSPEK